MIYVKRDRMCSEPARAPRESRTSRGSRASRVRALALLAVATIALGGLGFTQPAPAQAASLHVAQQERQQELGEAHPDDVTTTTTLSLDNVPAVYGGVTVLSAAVTLDGPMNLMGQPVYFEADGVTIATGYLLYIGEGRFGALALLTTDMPAGTHTLTARFAGVMDGDPTTPDAFPSTSAGVEVTIAQAATTTVITAAPASTRAFAPVDVTAQVTSAVAGLTGNAALLADGSPVMYEDLAPDGSVLFDDAVIPWGTTALTVAFLGDTGGNFALSTSAVHAIEVSAIETTLVPSAVRVQGTVTEPAVVDLTASEVPLQPNPAMRGSATGAPADGVVQAFVGADPLGDPVAITDGAGRLVLAGLGAGVHEVELRFTPGARGLLESAAKVEVTVLDASAGGGGSASGDGTPTTLSKTGADPTTLPLALGAAALMLGAVAAWAATGAGRRSAVLPHSGRR